VEKGARVVMWTSGAFGSGCGGRGKGGEESLHNGEDLEEIVFGKVFVGVVFV